MHRVLIRDLAGAERLLAVPEGANLRQVLLDAGLSPYGPLTRRANCGGNGLCATCGVWLDPAPEPEHWHDRLAARYGYPRLSCQITVRGDLTVRLVPKAIWGPRRPSGAQTEHDAAQQGG